MKKIITFLFLLAFLPLIAAIDLDVQKLSSNESVILGVDESINVTFLLKNNGLSSTFHFYSIGPFSFSDFEGKEEVSSDIYLEKGETKNITLKLFKRPDLKKTERITFPYYIQAKDKSEIEQKLTIIVSDLNEAFEVGSTSLDPQAKTISIYIKNKLNYNFKDLNVKFSSPFFSVEKEISLLPYQGESFDIELDRGDFEKLSAGFYTLNAKIKYFDQTGNVEGKIEFVEKDLLETKSKEYGFFIITNEIEKANEGNTFLTAQTTIKKNIFTRLFTTYSPEPTQVEREGTKVYYTWIEKIGPGEELSVVVKTNWLLPFLIIFFFITLIYFAKKYATQKVIVRKRVSFVKAKGGEFALKVTLLVEAREFVENLRIIDKIPPLVSMFERYGGELPDKISKDKKRLEWNYSYLDAGEKRVMSYLVYSKVGILGKFALPNAICRYNKEGKERESNSNKTFFISDQKNRREFF